VETLKRMIQDDAEHAAKASKPWDKMTTDERVAELTFRLRDQNGMQMGQPGGCDIFENRTGKTDTAAHQLVAIGFDAVPQLIAALDDQGLSRSVTYGRDFFFSHRVLTVGDCAQAILGRIAGRQFSPRFVPSGSGTGGGIVASTKQQVDEWWDAVARRERGRL